MADNFYKLRNNYLGIEGNNSRVEPHQLMRLSKGDQNPHNMTEALEHSQNQFSSVFKNSGNYGRESSEKYRQSNIHKFYEVKESKQEIDDIENQNYNNIRDKDSIYSIFEGNNEKYKNLSKIPLKSSLRDASNERSSSQQQKTVSFMNMRDSFNKTEIDQNVSNNKCIVSQMYDKDKFLYEEQNTIEALHKDSTISLSPFERSMANYKATKEKLLEAEMKRLNERKLGLTKMKQERELRNSKIKSFISSQNLSSSQLNNYKNSSSQNVFDFENAITEENKTSIVNQSELESNIKKTINNDLEDIGLAIGDNHNDSSPTKSDNDVDNTKRRLEYMDVSQNASNDDQEEIIQLTPHVLEESKTYERSYSKVIEQKPQRLYLEEQKYINITNDTPGYENIDVSQSTPSPHKKYSVINEEASEETPKMIISVEHKSSPSSYYKGSNSSHSGSEQDENDKTTLAFYEIVADAETLDFLNYYFEDTPNEVDIKEFAACICNEFTDMLNDYDISKETFVEELEDKLAKDENSLSFNKLHLYTKDIGFNAYIENLVKEIKQKIDSREKEENNKEIFTQLLEVKAELEQKDRDLKQKEREIKLCQAEIDTCT